MRHGRIIVIVILCVVGGLYLWGVSSRAAAGAALPASGSPSPSASPAPVVAPASTATVLWALRQRSSAVTAWLRWNRARECVSLRVVPFNASSARRPDRSEPRAVWAAAAAAWRIDRDAYRDRTGRLVQRMKHPGGTGGARWRALALWAGWTPAEWPTVLYIMAQRGGNGESGGNPRAFNAVIDCTGLLQVWPQHVVDWLHLAWSAAIRWLMDPENNLRISERIQDREGWGPWAL